MNFRLVGIVLVAACLSGCGRSSEHQAPTEVKDSPDIVAKAAEPGSRSRAFALRAFQVSQIWGGDGHPSEDEKIGNYRAKITLWDNDSSEGGTALAELFFRDAAQIGSSAQRANPDPNDGKEARSSGAQSKGSGRTYRLIFSMSTFDSIAQTLRFANSDVYLYYHDNQWAIGTDSGEMIGSN